MVIELVSVKDKKGNPIKGLTAKDFTLTEDGVAQKISYVDQEDLPTTPTDAPILPAEPEDIKIYNKLSRESIPTEPPGSVLYKDHRLIALYFDMVAMPNQADQIRALSAAQKFIRTQMTTADLVAIMRYSGSGPEVLQNFTADRNRLLSIIQTMVVGEGQGLDESTSDDSTADSERGVWPG